MKKKIEQVQRIMQLALEISTETEHDVFVRYAAHVQLVEIRIHADGLYARRQKKELEVYLDEQCEDLLSDAIAELEYLQAHGELRR